MAKLYESIDPELAAWLQAQHMFFVATAPLAADGCVNTSPKGMDCFRILGAREVAYLDMPGSGIETVAHLRENGRIVFMFCAFAGPPKIVRLHGHGEVVIPDSDDWEALRGRFPDYPGARSIVRVQIRRIADSCGFAVPRLDYVEDRDVLLRAIDRKGPAGMAAMLREQNARSIDGLPGMS